MNDCRRGAGSLRRRKLLFYEWYLEQVNARVRAALEQMSLADLIDPAQLFPIAGDDDEDDRATSIPHYHQSTERTSRMAATTRQLSRSNRQPVNINTGL